MKDKPVILVVDDQPQNIELLEAYLVPQDYEIVKAANGEEALEKLHAQHFGIVISDILMPVMDGFRLCRECKMDAALRNIPFVFYTSTYTDTKDEEFALSLGADRFIRKPMPPGEFVKIIADVVHRAAKGKIASGKPTVRDETETFKLYSERLVQKLERKMLDLAKEVTERKRAEETLRESEERYRSLFNTMKEGVAINEIVLDKKGDVVDYIVLSVNPAFGKQSIYSTEQVVGKRATDVYQMSPEYIRSWWKSHAQITKSVQTEMYHEPSGRWFSITTTPPEGKHFATIFTDITERKQSEENISALLKETTRTAREWESTFDAVTDIVSLISPDHTFLKINNAGCRAAGKSEKELIGKKCYEVIHGLHAPIAGCPCAETLTTKLPGSGEIQDKGRYYIATAAPILSDSGEMVAFAHTVKDITERKQMEAEREKAARFDSIGTLAGGIAHDFNNLLTGILGNIQLADGYLKQNRIDTAQEMLSEAEKESFRARDLTQQLLTFSKGGLPVKKVITINQLIRESATFALRGSNVKPEFALTDNLWAVEADEGIQPGHQ